MESSALSDDISSQQTMINQLRDKLKANEDLLKGKENSYAELQQRFNKLKFLQKSTAIGKSDVKKGPDDSPSQMVTSMATSMTTSMTTSMATSVGGDSDDSSKNVSKGKVLLLKKQLDECRAIIERHEKEKSEMSLQLEQLRDEKGQSQDAEFIDADLSQYHMRRSSTDSDGNNKVNELFAQIVYKDTKIMEMSQKISDLETRIMDLHENLKEQSEVLQARNRAIKVLMSQSQDSAGLTQLTFDEVIEREEQRERIEKLKERVTELEVEKGNLQLKVMELEGTNGSKPPLIDIEMERDVMRAERDDWKVKYNQIVAKFDSLELQKDKVANDKELLSNEMKHLKELNANFEREREKLKVQVQQLAYEINDREKSERSLSAKLENVMQELSDKENDIVDARNQLSELAKRSKTIVAERESIIAKLRLDLEQKSDNILLEKDEIIEDLRAEIDRLKDDKWKLTNDTQTLREENESVIANVSSLENQLKELNEKLCITIEEQKDVEMEKKIIIDKYSEEINVKENENIEMRKEMENLLNEKQNIEFELNQRLQNADETLTMQSNQLSTLENEKAMLTEELEVIRSSLETEKQRKHETLEINEMLKSEKFQESEFLADKNKEIEALKAERDEFETLFNNQKLEINEFYKKFDESSTIISDLENDLMQKTNAYEQLLQNHNEYAKSLEMIEEVKEQNTVLEEKLSDAKLKNQALGNEMEKLIVLMERESREKGNLKEMIERLQSEKFEENDFIREKDQRIESLQHELMKQVNDMKEIEDMVNDKQQEIEALNNDIRLLHNDKQNLQKLNETIQKQMKSIELANSDVINAKSLYEEKIEMLNKENVNANDALNTLKSQFIDSVNENNELKQFLNDLKSEKQSESEAINEKLKLIDELNSELNLVKSKLKETDESLRQKIEESEIIITENTKLNEEILNLHSQLKSNSETINSGREELIRQFNSADAEYKALLEESRLQVERLEYEKFMAIQETNEINRVLETERENQKLIETEKNNLVLERDRIQSKFNELQVNYESLRLYSQDSYNSIEVLQQQIMQYQNVHDDRDKKFAEEKQNIINEKNLLEFQIINLNTQLQQLQSVNNESLGNTDILRITIDELQKEVNDVKREKMEIQENFKLLESEINDQNRVKMSQLTELQYQLNSKDADYGEKLSHSNAAIESLQTDKENMSIAYFQMETKYNEMMNKIQPLEEYVHSEETKLREYEESKYQLTMALNDANSVRDKTLSDLSQMKIEFNNTIDNLKRQNETLINEIEGYKSFQLISDDCEKQIEALTKDITSLNETNLNLNQCIQEFKENELTLKAKINEYQQEYDRRNMNENDSQTKINEYEHSIEVMRQNYEIDKNNYELTLQEKVKENNSYIKQIESLEGRVNDMQKEQNELIEKDSYFRGKIEEIQQMKHDQHLQLQSENDNKTMEFENRIEELRYKFNMDIDNLQKENSNLIAINSQLSFKIEDLQNQIQLSYQNNEMNRNVNEKYDNEISNLRIHSESLMNQLEIERNERLKLIEQYETRIGESTFQHTNLFAQMDSERQLHLQQKSEIELRCKKFAAKLKVKEREVNSLEEKLKIAKDNASKNVIESDVIERDTQLEEMKKKIDDLQFTATNLDAALQSERQRRRELEDEVQTLWKSKAHDAVNDDFLDPEIGNYSLLIDNSGSQKSPDKSNTVKRFFTRQKHLLLHGPPHARYKRFAVILYLIIFHVLLFKMCLF